MSSSSSIWKIVVTDGGSGQSVLMVQLLKDIVRPHRLACLPKAKLWFEFVYTFD